MIPGSANSLLLRSAAAGGYEIERSLRFNSSDSGFCGRNFSSAGNQKTWSWSAWVKKCNVSTQQSIWSAGSTGTNRSNILFQGTGEIRFFNYAGSVNVDLVTTPVFRDPSAWYHILAVADTTQATASNRFKLYINGTQITAFATASYPSQNLDLVINSAITHGIGRGEQSGGEYFDGYLADIWFVDSQALTPSAFGEFDATTGVWNPKAYSGPALTGNSFHLDFADNSAATAAALGKDTSGNGNNWTPNNLSVTAGAGNDSLVDSPTNYGTDTGVGGEVRGNYATLNPLDNGGITLSNGNLDWAGNGAGTKVSYGTVAVSSGKWYFEASINGATGGVNWECGIARIGTANNSRPGGSANGWQVSSSSTTTLVKNNSGSSTSIYSSGLSNGDILGVAFDIDNGRIWFARNGVWLEGNPSAGTGASFTNVSGTVAPFGGSDGSGPSSAMNFGQRPFAYPLSGFKALCTANLPTPTIANGATAMDVKLYTGNGSTQTISGLNFSPDLVWIKNRAAAYGHIITDSVRGNTKQLYPYDTQAESTEATALTAFNSDGFSLGSWAPVNVASNAHVAWCWDAGTSTVTNTQGSITSQVRANASAGFSVVTYTGTGSNATVGHGLGVAPGMIIVKRRNTTSNWQVRHTSIAAANSIQLNATSAAASATTVWNSTAPSSTVFSIGTDASVNASGGTYVAYCFAPVAGYSSFGSYTGNGSTDGPFVYTGFRPRWLMIKCSSIGDAFQHWHLFDTSRSPINVSKERLQANKSAAEDSFSVIDLLSSGFKIRYTDAYFNQNGSTWVYAAFAESPFAYARAR